MDDEQLIDAIPSFEDWINQIFDHPVTRPQWYFVSDASNWNYRSAPAVVLEYLTRLFRWPRPLMGRFIPGQLNDGINYLISNGASDYMYVLFDRKIPQPHRTECIAAIFDLYERCFTAKCTPHLSHQHVGATPSSVSPLNAICYMFWDIIPIHPQTQIDYDSIINNPELFKELAPDVREATERVYRDLAVNWKRRPQDEIIDREQIEAACLDVMERCLTIDHMACRESALHGLGHWHDGYPERVEAIVGRFLGRQNLSAELRNYAECARVGGVL